LATPIVSINFADERLVVLKSRQTPEANFFVPSPMACAKVLSRLSCGTD
jgi:hypothetical protein